MSFSLDVFVLNRLIDLIMVLILDRLVIDICFAIQSWLRNSLLNLLLLLLIHNTIYFFNNLLHAVLLLDILLQCICVHRLIYFLFFLRKFIPNNRNYFQNKNNLKKSSLFGSSFEFIHNRA